MMPNPSRGIVATLLVASAYSTAGLAEAQKTVEEAVDHRTASFPLSTDHSGSSPRGLGHRAVLRQSLEPTPIGRSATAAFVTPYARDDGRFEDSSAHEGTTEAAQGFLIQPTTSNLLHYVEACFLTCGLDGVADPGRMLADDLLSFRLYRNGRTIHGDPAPDRQMLEGLDLGDFLVAVTTSPLGSALGGDQTCIRSYFSQLPLALPTFERSVILWVSVTWSFPMKILVDRSVSTVYSVFRDRPPYTWYHERNPVAIRLGIVHSHDDVRREPKPPSADRIHGYTDCVPKRTPLVFDGDYRISMCYETPVGEVGESKGGIWASGESGLLWFFNRDNAEALVKVLHGCSFNGHMWVFVAPVTTLALNLHVTDRQGRRWSYRNRQGEVAASVADTTAFSCP